MIIVCIIPWKTAIFDTGEPRLTERDMKNQWLERELHICNPEIRCTILKVVRIDGIIIAILSLEALKGWLFLYGIYLFYVYIYTHICESVFQAQIIYQKQELLQEIPMCCYSGGQIRLSGSELSFACGEGVQSLFPRENPF